MRISLAVLGLGLLAAGAPSLAQPPAPPGPAMPSEVPHTLAEALGTAYETNPQLTGERAHLRSVDEGVPAALSGWRPTITVSGSVGYADGSQRIVALQQTNIFSPKPSDVITRERLNRDIFTDQATVTQYLYKGGHTVAATHQAVNSVYAERARLIAEEEQVFSDTVTAYVTVIEDQNLLDIDRANELVLGKELQATNDRFRVGELTRTDVAQAQAAYAQAIATRQTAEGNLQTARASFVREVGVEPPTDLSDPQPLRLPVKSEQEAADLAAGNNPNVIAALFNEVQAKDAIDVAFSALGPQISIQGTGAQDQNSSFPHDRIFNAQALLNIDIPIYQGGAEYAAVRQARQNFQQAVRQTEDARRAAREQAVQQWDTLVAAQAAIQSSKISVRSNEIAVEGLEREAIVGSATTTDVLVAQQNLLTAQTTLVQNVTSLINGSYGVASAIGRLTASDMGLAVPLYDETAYYNAVRDRLFGTGDFAIHQPGR